MKNDSVNVEDSNPRPSGWFKGMFSSSKDDKLREALEEFIEDSDDENEGVNDVSKQERALISNILKVKDYTAVDVMIPRADIAAIELNDSAFELLEKFSATQFGRLIVYKGTLDNVVGYVHIKDIIAKAAVQEDFQIKDLVKEIPIISPALPVMELLMLMQASRRHVGLVIDEFGGTDGLVTIGDVVESILGNISDEYDQYEQPELRYLDDKGFYICDARYEIDDFLQALSVELPEDDRDEIDTVGGLLFYYAGRVPASGEIIKLNKLHLKFEVLEADPRCVHKLKVTKL